MLSWTDPLRWGKVLSVCAKGARGKLAKIRKRKQTATFGCEKMVYGDKLAMFFPEDEIGIIIESEAIAETYRTQFEGEKKK